MPLIDPDGSYVIYIQNPEHCRKVQLRLFELGFSWPSEGRNLYAVERAHRLFLNYDDGPHDRMKITYVSDPDWGHREGLEMLTLEELYDRPEEAPKKAPRMKKGPTFYSQWNLQCLAKHIIAKYPTTGSMREALSILARGGKQYHTDKELLDYALKYKCDRPKNLPSEILQELMRRQRDA